MVYSHSSNEVLFGVVHILLQDLWRNNPLPLPPPKGCRGVCSGLGFQHTLEDEPEKLTRKLRFFTKSLPGCLKNKATMNRWYRAIHSSCSSSASSHQHISMHSFCWHLWEGNKMADKSRTIPALVWRDIDSTGHCLSNIVLFSSTYLSQQIQHNTLTRQSVSVIKAMFRLCWNSVNSSPAIKRFTNTEHFTILLVCAPSKVISVVFSKMLQMQLQRLLFFLSSQRNTTTTMTEQPIYITYNT